jgi:glycosyltransferase involved in cell wall biosynthesis
MRPSFSVLIPVYNRELYVRECLDSVLAQTDTSFEIIVVDDGSTDRSMETLRSYGDKIKILAQKNQGPEVARQLGAASASGDYLVFLDSDDLLLPWALAAYRRIIEELDSPALIIGRLHYFRDGQFALDAIPPAKAIELHRYGNYLEKDVPVGLSCSNFVIRKSSFDPVGLRQSSPKTFHADEHDMVLRFGTIQPCVIMEKPATVAYRMHGGNTVNDVKGMVHGCLSLVDAERRGGYPGGKKLRVLRYAIIGGVAMCWVKHAMREGQPRLGLKLFVRAAPMIAAGAWHKLSGLFRRKASSLIEISLGSDAP